MLRILIAMRQNLQNIRKSPRVADENMPGSELPIRRTRGSGWIGLSVIYGVVRAPLAVLSCFSHPNANGTDGAWVSSEYTPVSELNHLMVSDSMRYAILM